MPNRKTLNFDKDVKEYLDKQDNASAVANRAVRAWMESDGGREGMLELRLRQVESEGDEAQARADRLQKEAERLREELTEVRAEEQADERETFEQAVERMQYGVTVLSSGVDVDDDELQAVADKYGVDRDALRAAAVDRWGGDDA